MQYAHACRIHPGRVKSSGAMLAPIRRTNAGSCPSRQRDCVAEPIRLANAAAPLLLRSQARRKAYRARSAETKGTAQLPCGSGETQGEGVGDGEISNAECGLACTYCELRTARTDRTGN